MRKNTVRSRINTVWTGYRKDILLAAAVLAAVVVLLFLYQGRNGKDAEESADGVLEITVDGEVYGRYPLNQEQEINLVTAYGKNTVVIEDDTAYVIEADCLDKICVEMQKISRDGEMICCLPHRLILTVRGAENVGYDAIAYDCENGSAICCSPVKIAL